MAKNKKETRHMPSARRQARRGPADESKASVACTVAWTMAALAAFAAEVVGTGALLTQHLFAQPALAQMGAYLMLWIAMGTGLAALALTPVVLWVRDDPPPRGLLATVILVSSLPLVTGAAILVGR